MLNLLPRRIPATFSSPQAVTGFVNYRHAKCPWLGPIYINLRVASVVRLDRSVDRSNGFDRITITRKVFFSIVHHASSWSHRRRGRRVSSVNNAQCTIGSVTETLFFSRSQATQRSTWLYWTCELLEFATWTNVEVHQGLEARWCFILRLWFYSHSKAADVGGCGEQLDAQLFD